MDNTLVITSGYYGILHAGHVECIQRAKELGDKLFVIVNNDSQSLLKKGKIVMPQDKRLYIVSNIKNVDKVVLSIDMDGTVCKTIEYIAKFYMKDYKKMIFAKGGDRTANEIPEAVICSQYGIQIVDGLGNKIDSSSNYYNAK